MRDASLVPLSRDHHHALALAVRCRKQALGQIKPTGPDGLRERAAEVLRFYAHNLVAHFRAEEKILFPLLQSLVPESRQLVDELSRDHEQIRAAVRQLETAPGLSKIIFDLGDLLEKHVRREERELFPLFEKHASKNEAQTAGGRIKAILEAGPGT
jgi:iron-sulfur cluster repair protein YtfE (RIC family)